MSSPPEPLIPINDVRKELKRFGSWWTTVPEELVEGVFAPMRLLLRLAGEDPQLLPNFIQYMHEGPQSDGEITSFSGLARPKNEDDIFRETVTLHFSDPEWRQYGRALLLPFVDACSTVAEELTWELFPEFITGFMARFKQGLVTPQTRGGAEFGHLAFFRYPHPNSDFFQHADQSVLGFGLQGEVDGVRLQRDGEMVKLPPNSFYIQTGDNARDWSNGRVPDGEHDVQQEGANRETFLFFYSPSVYDLIRGRYMKVTSQLDMGVGVEITPNQA